MSFPYAPARFSDADRRADALRIALSGAVYWAPFVCADATRAARMEADRYASIDGLCGVRKSLAFHSAQYLAAVRRASELAKDADEIGFQLNPRKPVEDADAAAELARLSAIIEACTDKGEPAPVLVLVAVQRLVAGVR